MKKGNKEPKKATCIKNVSSTSDSHVAGLPGIPSLHQCISTSPGISSPTIFSHFVSSEPLDAHSQKHYL